MFKFSSTASFPIIFILSTGQKDGNLKSIRQKEIEELQTLKLLTHWIEFTLINT